MAEISQACARNSHKSCRGRILLPDATDPKKRWGPCECGCPHDRGDGCLEYARRPRSGDD